MIYDAYHWARLHGNTNMNEGKPLNYDEEHCGRLIKTWQCGEVRRYNATMEGKMMKE
jgi:hypothetical protein